MSRYLVAFDAPQGGARNGATEGQAIRGSAAAALNWLAERVDLPLATAASMAEQLADGGSAGYELRGHVTVRINPIGVQTATERKAAERARRTRLGLQRSEAWVHPEDLPKLKAYLAKLTRARVKR